MAVFSYKVFIDEISKGIAETSTAVTRRDARERWRMQLKSHCVPVTSCSGKDSLFFQIFGVILKN